MSVHRSRFMVHNDRWSEMVSSSMLFGPQRIEEESEVLRSPWYGHGGQYLRVYRTPHEVLSWHSFWGPKSEKNKRGHEGPVSRPENGHGFRAQKTVTLRSGQTRGPPVVTKSAPSFWPRKRVPGTPKKNDPDETKQRDQKTKRGELISTTTSTR